MPGVASASSSAWGAKPRLAVSAAEMPEMTRGLPSTRPCMKRGKVLELTIAESTSTKVPVEFLSASGNAAKIGSIAPGPSSLSLLAAFWAVASAGPVDDLTSVTSRSARKFVKKLIQPCRREPYTPTLAVGYLPERPALRAVPEFLLSRLDWGCPCRIFYNLSHPAPVCVCAPWRRRLRTAPASHYNLALPHH